MTDVAIDWQRRYELLAAAARETRERCANFAGMKLSDFQRNTLFNVMDPISVALDHPDEGHGDA